MATDTRHQSPGRFAPPTLFVGVVGGLMAMWCLGFAVVNIWFEVTGYFAEGDNAAIAALLSVMDWFVVVIKLIGALVAILAITPPPKIIGPSPIGMALWAGFSTLGIYVIGATIQGVGLLTGIFGDPSQVTPASIGYLFAFVVAAVGFGIVAVSYTRRMGLRKSLVIFGVCGGPALLFVTLVVVPALVTMLLPS